MIFSSLQPQPPDALLALIGLFRDDPRPHKLDLGVGVYRDEAGGTPVFRAVKAAERQIVESQPTKAYLGPEGDVEYVARLAPYVLGPGKLGPDLFGVQTPGGTGALRLAADLIAASKPDARVWVGAPTWPNHVPILKAAGLKVETYRYFDPATQRLTFGEMMDAFGKAGAGDIVLVHGCCHNPTGADLSVEQWRALAEVVSTRGLVPLVDLAYQGLGDGLEADAAGARLMLEAADAVLIAHSCDKNFGVYRERTGALFVAARGMGETVRSNALALARTNWSMPPDHGALVVRTILESDALTKMWRDELDSMCARIGEVRQTAAALHPGLAALRAQKGMFATLPLSPAQVKALREEHAVYVAGSGRVMVAGLTTKTAGAFAQALSAVGYGALS